MSDPIDRWYENNVLAYVDPAQDTFKWYYVEVSQVNGSPCLRVMQPGEFGPRPPDARPAHGNPATPWYQAGEHMDENHIHIKALDEYHALRRAHAMLREKKHGSVFNRLKVTFTK